MKTICHAFLLVLALGCGTGAHAALLRGNQPSQRRLLLSSRHDGGTPSPIGLGIGPVITCPDGLAWNADAGKCLAENDQGGRKLLASLGLGCWDGGKWVCKRQLGGDAFRWAALTDAEKRTLEAGLAQLSDGDQAAVLDLLTSPNAALVDDLPAVLDTQSAEEVAARLKLLLDLNADGLLPDDAAARRRLLLAVVEVAGYAAHGGEDWSFSDIIPYRRALAQLPGSAITQKRHLQENGDATKSPPARKLLFVVPLVVEFDSCVVGKCL